MPPKRKRRCIRDSDERFSGSPGRTSPEALDRPPVSASLLTQIENGKSRPSVDTLYAIRNALDLSIDELFSNVGAGEAPPPESRTEATQADHPTHSFRGALAQLDEPKQRAAGPVVQPGDRRQLALDSGVTWDQLSAAYESDVDFLFVRYEVGGSSVHGKHLTRHSGIEYGYVLSGTPTPPRPTASPTTATSPSKRSGSPPDATTPVTETAQRSARAQRG